ncbi:MAG: glycoside hydrolase family 3 C-terminal domain-containing protein, partial [Gemmatimonadaceae bacterium]|nr:glycoside hydrolase family 3 C-terminal domain-containing protein [Gemmatimonadaceae bacterium]
AALVAAWLPGSEGQGVADVLFGGFDFEGRLGFGWPAGGEGATLGVREGETRFSRGHGLLLSDASCDDGPWRGLSWLTLRGAGPEGSTPALPYFPRAPSRSAASAKARSASYCDCHLLRAVKVLRRGRDLGSHAERLQSLRHQVAVGSD